MPRTLPWKTSGGASSKTISARPRTVIGSSNRPLKRPRVEKDDSDSDSDGHPSKLSRSRSKTKDPGKLLLVDGIE